MTRLTPLDITDIGANLNRYDAELLFKTGCNLKSIACRATGVEENIALDLFASTKVAVIPMTCGQGVIDGFTSTVRQIVAHLGYKTFVTRLNDVGGLAEAFNKKSDIIMLSDDDHFVAINVKSRRVIDNADATGRGFATGLNLMVGGLKAKNVLVIGCGSVGRSATFDLIRLGASVSVYDIHRERCDRLAREMKELLDAEIRIVKELNSALTRNRCIIDASPAANLINAGHITRDTYISAPGVPSGLSPGARSKIAGRILHDPLQIGVATMAVEAVKE